MHGLILPEGAQQIAERRSGDIEGGYGRRESHEDGMRRPARVAPIEFLLPAVQQLERAQGAGYFVAQVIGPTAVGINVIEMPAQAARQEPSGYVEVFIMVRRKPAGVGLGLAHGACHGGKARDISSSAGDCMAARKRPSCLAAGTPRCRAARE